MKILFNLSVTQPVGNVKRHGGGIYGEIVFKRIVERELPVCCCYDGDKWLNPEIKEIIDANNIECYDISQQSLNDIVKKAHVDIHYSPLFIGLNDFDACKLICTIHGLRGVETPRDPYFFKYKSTLKEKVKFLLRKYFPSVWNKRERKSYEMIACKKNLDFVTVSNHSRAAFVSFFPDLFADRDIPVFYSPSTLGNNVIENREIKEKYFLLVSGGIWAKNNIRAIMAFDRLFTNGLLKEYKVIVTGVKDLKAIKYKIKNPDRFDIRGYVSDHELHQLFHDAYSLVYPSINEGFGYPPVEAMSYGVPVLASPFTSIPEVCQDAALYFNPYSVEEIMNRILQITDMKLHDMMCAKAEARYECVYEKQQEDLDGLIDYIYR